MVTTLDLSPTGQPAVETDFRAGDRSEVHSSEPAPTSSTTTMTREEFSIVFDRCFDRVYSYAARRIEDRAICERVAEDVLTSNLHLLVDRVDDGRIARALKVSSDMRIDEQRVSKLSTRVGEIVAGGQIV
jgi:hypothetical protein